MGHNAGALEMFNKAIAIMIRCLVNNIHSTIRSFNAVAAIMKLSKSWIMQVPWNPLWENSLFGDASYYKMNEERKGGVVGWWKKIKIYDFWNSSSIKIVGWWVGGKNACMVVPDMVEVIAIQGK